MSRDGPGGRGPRDPRDRRSSRGGGTWLPWEDAEPWERRGRSAGSGARKPSGRPTRGSARTRTASSQKAKPKARKSAQRKRRRRLARLGSPSRRISVGMLIVAFILTMFTGRLVLLQGVNSSKYATQAAQQRVRTQTLYAERGTITDRNGTPLAMTADASDLYVDPTRVPDKPGKLSDGTEVLSKQQTAGALARILGVPAEDLLAKLTSDQRFVYLAKHITPAQLRQAKQLPIPTLGADPDPVRQYPSGELAASVLGYVGSDGHGLGGMELAMDNVLAGHDGKQVIEIGANGTVIPASPDKLREAQPGKDVRLTLDSEIQWKAERELRRQVAKTKSQSGTVIVMNPETGAVLALATAPSFDPSDLEHASAEALGNPAISNVYEPGSTNKVITAAAALEHTSMQPRTEVVVPGELRRYDKTFHDDVPHSTWHLTLSGVLAKSSNIGIDLVSEKVGKKQLYKSLIDFGFGKPTGIGLPGESGGILPPPDKWSGTQRYTIPFGQGVSVTAVQMAAVYATIANGGVRAQPNVVAGTQSQSGAFHPKAAPGHKRVMSPHSAKQLRLMLEGVTSEKGTAPAAQIDGYRVAGKTGTANRVAPDCGCYRGYTASFVGMAPADDPKLVTEVVLQDPKRGHFGGQVAAPVFHDVMAFALQHDKVQPTGTKRPDLKIWANR
ncbi:MAG: peptidoglycan D,D-transpeptidase FtsI family protein [Streptosporangiales bacterium]